MEHVTIISQEAITRGLWWPPVIIGVIAILTTLVFTTIIGGIKRDVNIFIKGYIIVLVLFPVMLICMFVCNRFFPVETGRYNYEGTLDPDMTIVDFEEFQQQYNNVRFEDGVWKWEDKE